MTNREIILHCLKEDTDVTCRKSPCGKPEQEGNTGECCDKCALGILEEYEREVRSKAIDDCFVKAKTMMDELFYQNQGKRNGKTHRLYCVQAMEFLRQVAEQLKVGGNDGC